jgi:subfamily B ATP-binding cassette protein MsbA
LKRFKENITYLWDLFGVFRKRFVLLIILMAIASIFECFNLAIILPVLESLVNDEMGGFLGSLFSPIVAGFRRDLWPFVMALFFLMVTFVKVLLLIFNNYYKASLVNTLRLHWRLGLFQKYISSEYAYIIDHRQGELLHNLESESGKAGKMLSTLADLFFESLAFLCIYILLLVTHCKITFMLTVLLLTIVLISRFVGEKYLVKLGSANIRVSQKMNSYAAEVIAAIRQTKLFSIESTFYEKYRDAGRTQVRILIKTSVLQSLPVNAVLILIALAFVFILGYFTFFSDENIKAFIPTIGFFVIVSQRMSVSLSRIFRNRVVLYNLAPSLKLVQSILNSDLRVENLAAGKMYQRLDGDIVLKDICFSYPNGKTVFENLNMTFPYGKTTAIMGASGSGKSTLADLLVRLYNPDSGHILVNGKDIREYSLLSWRKMIGFVTQDTCIFNMSIKENILVGNPDAVEDELREALKIANCLEFVDTLPDGWDTTVGDRGVKLSGGQRQRIAIARAIVRQPDLYIFDEATSSLDDRSEKLIQKSIEELSERSTVVVITHRFSTVKNANTYYNLE